MKMSGLAKKENPVLPKHHLPLPSDLVAHCTADTFRVRHSDIVKSLAPPPFHIHENGQLKVCPPSQMLTFVCLNNIRQRCGFPTSAHHMAQIRCRLTHRWKLRTHLDLVCFDFSRLWRVLTHLTVCEMPFSLLLGRGVEVCVYENIPLTVWSPLLTGHNFCQLVNLVAW